jgi:hypothetical protein
VGPQAFTGQQGVGLQLERLGISANVLRAISTNGNDTSHDFSPGGRG